MREASVVIEGLDDGPTLDGVWFGEGERTAVVGSPHPLMGGHMRTPPGLAAVSGLVDAGLRVLAFDFRGVGRSTGVPSGETRDADADFQAALTVARRAGTVAVVAGYSFGGAAAIRVSAAQGLRAVALAPPTFFLGDGDVAAVGSGLGVIVGEEDTIVSARALARLVGEHGGEVELLPGVGHFFGGALDAARAFAARRVV
jgi:alpha/beta superfamily hydrolase